MPRHPPTQYILRILGVSALSLLLMAAGGAETPNSVLEDLRAADRARASNAAEAQAWAEEKARLELLLAAAEEQISAARDRKQDGAVEPANSSEPRFPRHPSLNSTMAPCRLPGRSMTPWTRWPSRFRRASSRLGIAGERTPTRPSTRPSIGWNGPSAPRPVSTLLLPRADWPANHCPSRCFASAGSRHGGAASTVRGAAKRRWSTVDFSLMKPRRALSKRSDEPARSPKVAAPQKSWSCP